MENRRSLTAPLLVFGGLLLLCFVFALVLFASVGRDRGARTPWEEGSGPRIGVVEIDGVITSSKQTIEHLVEFRRDKHIKAILVRIDSPGGAVGPSQELYRAIERARKDKKVVVSMGTVAASGGYYIASAADRIYAMPGTITGSIGVISQFPQVDGLLELAHLGMRTVKSGELKDVGSPFRAMTDEERKFVQHFVDSIHEQFISDVASARHLDKEAVRRIADGRILTGEEARQAKLVDEMGNFEEALDGAMKLAGATGEPVPVFARPHRSLLGELLHESADSMIDGARQALRGAAGASIEAREPYFR